MERSRADQLELQLAALRNRSAIQVRILTPLCLRSDAAPYGPTLTNLLELWCEGGHRLW